MPLLNKESILAAVDYRIFWEQELSGRITRRTGANWQAHSPFREDWNPSFSVNVKTGLWNDFAGEGGDVFRFTMLRHRLSFPDALAYVERYRTLYPRRLDLDAMSNGATVRHSPKPKAREYPPEEFRFFELVEGSPGNRKRGHMVEISPECPAGVLLDLYGQPPGEAYTSAFLYPIEAVQYRDNPDTGGGKGSLAGYVGPVKVPVAFFDFDSKEDPGTACWDVAALLFRLEDMRSYAPENVRVFFSGSKGFHVLLLDPAIEFLPGAENAHIVAEGFCRKLCGDLHTFDGAVYDKSRLLRAINSRHPKTGLFKIPLTLDEINDVQLGIEEIRALACSPRRVV